jgi:hypothetical protein
MAVRDETLISWTNSLSPFFSRSIPFYRVYGWKQPVEDIVSALEKGVPDLLWVLQEQYTKDLRVFESLPPLQRFFTSKPRMPSEKLARKMIRSQLANCAASLRGAKGRETMRWIKREGFLELAQKPDLVLKKFSVRA